MPKVHDLSPTTTRMRTDVLAGLRQEPKRLPSHYLYDDRGARLFEQICETEAYYPTRTEAGIMADCAEAIRDRLGAGAMLIEPGSGSGDKAVALLGHMRDPMAYCPIDVAAEQLAELAVRVKQSFPDLNVVPICADFTQDHDLPLDHIVADRKVVFFPGSTVGNFEPDDARDLLRDLAALAGPEGGVLIGVDLKKDAELLEPAYDDPEGVSAEFAMNILDRLNRELDADFNQDQFQYQAPYNAKLGRIEMGLVSQCAQTVNIDDETIDFDAGENIVTEYSYKYAVDEFVTLADQADLNVCDVWTDANRMFSVQYLEPQRKSA